MTTYRCYLVDGSNQIRGVETAKCESDAEAMLRAAEMLDLHPGFDGVEVWDRTRLIGRAPRAS